VAVPLVLRWPGHLAAGRVVDAPVESVDVLPTVLELLGLPHDDAGRGRSLAGALLRGDALDAEHPVFTHRRPYDESAIEAGKPVHGALFGVRRGRWKWIEGTADGTRELFDLAADPREGLNLAARQPETAAALSSEVAAFRDAYQRGGPGGEVSPEDRERLRALGYAD
jgi:arylsulfatase A-like enzyme